MEHGQITPGQPTDGHCRERDCSADRRV